MRRTRLFDFGWFRDGSQWLKASSMLQVITTFELTSRTDRVD